MNIRKVLAGGYWQDVIAKARAASHRRAAVAFVTEDLVGFKKGDVLVVNASLRAIRTGATSAKLLLRLHDIGVSIYNCANLHAKVLLLDDTTVIGSGNMSDMSNRPSGGWQEAGLITNDSVVFSGVSAFVDRLVEVKDALLKHDRLIALTRIKVVRHGSWKGSSKKRQQRPKRLGNSTWITGLIEAKYTPAEDAYDARAKNELKDEGEAEDVIQSARYSLTSRIAKDVRPGDSVIVMWKPGKTSRTTVYRVAPVLRRRRIKNHVLIHYRETSGKYPTMSWTKFKMLINRAGYPRVVKPGSTRLVPTAAADALAKHWNTTAKL